MDDYILASGLHIRITRKAVRYFRCRVRSPHGDVAVSVPWHATRRQVEAFITERVAWIEQTHARVKAQGQQFAHTVAPAVAHGSSLHLWGERYTLRLIPAPAHSRTPLARRVQRHEAELWLTVAQEADPAATWQAWCKHAVQEAACALLPRWEARLGVHAHSVSARPMQTRWGSCTPATGRIRLSLNLSALAPEFLEYVLVHEMLHLVEAHHNARFYALLDTYLPTWRGLRTTLRQMTR